MPASLQGIDSQLAGFVRALRAAGAEASVAEAIDAARAVQLVGYADRETLKSSLSVALAKSLINMSLDLHKVGHLFNLMRDSENIC